MTIAQRIRAERERLELSKIDAARLTNINIGAYSQLEGSRGECNPTAATISKLVLAGFDVTRIFPEWFGETDPTGSTM